MATTFDVEVDDTSLMVNYYPFAETLGRPNLTAGWNTFYDGSGYLQTPGEIGNGTSFHVTSLEGAILAFEFDGTAIQLYGDVQNSSYDLALDGSSFVGQPDGYILGSFDNLKPGRHYISLTAHPGNFTPGLLSFDRAVVTASTGLRDATVETQVVESTEMLMVGQWNYTEEPLIPQGSHSYHISWTAGDKALLNFTGTAVSVSGVRNVLHGHYNVTFDGETISFNAESSFRTKAVLFSRTGLDPITTHTLEITNDEDNKALAIDAITITRTIGGTPLNSPPSGLPRGTIAALVVVAVVVVAALLAALAFCQWRRHHPPPSRQGSESNSSSSRHAYEAIRVSPERDVVRRSAHYREDSNGVRESYLQFDPSPPFHVDFDIKVEPSNIVDMSRKPGNTFDLPKAASPPSPTIRSTPIQPNLSAILTLNRTEPPRRSPRRRPELRRSSSDLSSPTESIPLTLSPMVFRSRDEDGKTEDGMSDEARPIPTNAIRPLPPIPIPRRASVQDAHSPSSSPSPKDRERILRLLGKWPEDPEDRGEGPSSSPPR